jgi:hypothetical protein
VHRVLLAGDADVRLQPLSKPCVTHSRVIRLPLSNCVPDKTPVEEQLRTGVLHFAQPLHTALLSPDCALYFCLGPSFERPVNVLKDLVHSRLIERSIVVPPSSYY